jgi:hypothetical protein
MLEPLLKNSIEFERRLEIYIAAKA